MLMKYVISPINAVILLIFAICVTTTIIIKYVPNLNRSIYCLCILSKFVQTFSNGSFVPSARAKVLMCVMFNCGETHAHTHTRPWLGNNLCALPSRATRVTCKKYTRHDESICVCVEGSPQIVCQRFKSSAYVCLLSLFCIFYLYVGHICYCKEVCTRLLVTINFTSKFHSLTKHIWID